MANQVPLLKKKFLSEPDYFKKVYKYVFELGKEDGAKVVGQYTQRVVSSVGRASLMGSFLFLIPSSVRDMGQFNARIVLLRPCSLTFSHSASLSGRFLAVSSPPGACV